MKNSFEKNLKILGNFKDIHKILKNVFKIHLKYIPTLNILKTFNCKIMGLTDLINTWFKLN